MFTKRTLGVGVVVKYIPVDPWAPEINCTSSCETPQGFLEVTLGHSDLGLTTTLQCESGTKCLQTTSQSYLIRGKGKVWVLRALQQRALQMTVEVLKIPERGKALHEPGNMNVLKVFLKLMSSSPNIIWEVFSAQTEELLRFKGEWPLSTEHSGRNKEASCIRNLIKCVLSFQSCPTLCEPMDCNPPGSSVHGILQARIQEWVAIPFSRRSSQLMGLLYFRRILYPLNHQGNLNGVQESPLEGIYYL